MIDVDELLKAHGFRIRGKYQQAITCTVSHEQMNPLNSIINFSQLVFEEIQSLLENLNSQMESNLNGDESPISPNLRNHTLVSKKELEEYMSCLKVVHNSSLMLKMFNQGMLNVTNIN